MYACKYIYIYIYKTYTSIKILLEIHSKRSGPAFCKYKPGGLQKAFRMGRCRSTLSPAKWLVFVQEKRSDTAPLLL